MHERKLSEEDYHCCFVEFTLKTIDHENRIVTFGNATISCQDDREDIREKYKNPVIIPGTPVKVYVYDREAVDFRNKQTFLGDTSNAEDRCERALEEQGYTVIHS